VKTLGFSDRAQVWTANVTTSLQRLEEAGTGFDIIFADPPFSRPAEFTSLCAALDKCASLLHNGTGNFPGFIVVQHHWKLALEGFASLRIAQSRRAGESLLTFLEI
jgi:16S rRNA G966 N2-methylase RsmD